VRKGLSLFIVLLLAAAAQAAPGLTADQTGSLYQFGLTTGEAPTLFTAKSLDQGLTFGPAQDLYRFTQAVDSCDLKVGPGARYYLAFATSREALFTWSTDRGKNFNPPVRLTAEAASPSIVGDSLGTIHLVYLKTDKLHGRQQLCYAATPEPQTLTAALTLEPVIIAESYQELARPKLTTTPWGIMITWQQRSPARAENFLVVSLDGGRHFSQPRNIPLQADIDELALAANKWLAYLGGKKFSARTVDFLPSPAPELAGLVLKPASVEVRYRTSVADPLICKIELSWYQDFPADKTWTFEHFSLPVSTEASYELPIDLPEGRYFLRLAAFDGLTTSQWTARQSFLLDRTAPVITLSAPTAETSEQRELLLEGQVSEAARLTLNGRSLTLEATGKFKTGLTLLPGSNRLLLLATDEAGNTAVLSREVRYSARRPEITINKPRPGDWFKPDSVIFIEADVTDPQNDIADESEAAIVLAGQGLDDKLVYDKTAGKLSGFVKLPAGLPDGQLSALIRLSDEAGNLGEKSWPLKIDQLPPLIALSSGESWHSNATATYALPLSDAGAGIDGPGTLVKISGVSVEGTASAESEIGRAHV